MAKRKAQMRDAGLEIVLEAGHCARQIAAIGRPDVIAQQPRQGRRGGLIAGGGAGLELGPDVFRQFACQIAHLVRQTALPQCAREALLDRPDDPGRTVADHQQRIRQAAPAHVAKEFAAARRVLLGARRQVQQRLLAVRQKAPGRQHCLAWLAQMQPLGNPVDKQVVTSNSVRSRLANASYSAHSRSVISLTALRLSRLRPSVSVNTASMSRVESPRAYISTARLSSSSVRPRTASRMRERNGALRSAICGALYSIAPSALVTRPGR